MTQTIYASRNQLAGHLELSSQDTLVVLVTTGFLTPVRTYKGMDYRSSSPLNTTSTLGAIQFDVAAVKAAMAERITIDPTKPDELDPSALPDAFLPLTQNVVHLKVSDTTLINRMLRAGLVERRRGRYYPTNKDANFAQFNEKTGYFEYAPKRLYQALAMAGVL